MESPITLEGVTLTAEEQRVLMLVWLASEVGVSPGFHQPAYAPLKPTADALVRRGLLYRVTGMLGPGDDPDRAGYALQGTRADWIAETLVDSSGLELHEIL